LPTALPEEREGKEVEILGKAQRDEKKERKEVLFQYRVAAGGDRKEEGGGKRVRMRLGRRGRKKRPLAGYADAWGRGKKKEEGPRSYERKKRERKRKCRICLILNG